MQRLDRQSKEKLEQFVAITNAPEKMAVRCLQVRRLLSAHKLLNDAFSGKATEV